MGAMIVGAAPGFEATLDGIRHHHERWDGGGYPSGLREMETPLPARIMAVADAFSAMTTDGPSRKGRRADEALAVLTTGAGTQWDPACVGAFLRACARRTYPFVPARRPWHEADFDHEEA
jgi:HD-GYP domain-containing protein (c-di-GMP phosphodiesterase class II)